MRNHELGALFHFRSFLWKADIAADLLDILGLPSHFDTHNGKTTTTHTYLFSYLILHLPYNHTPALAIRREGIFDKLAGALGFDDIDFESDQFSRRFHVKSDDKRFAYDVIHPRMMEFLLAFDPPAIEVDSGACCLNDKGRRWSPEEFHARSEWASQFFSLWPRHITAQLDREQSTT